MLDIAVILVEPARAGNVGAAARAMKTMGFTDMRIVSPAETTPWTQPHARAFAHGSTEILDAVTRFTTVQEAVADRDLVIGTTARRRGKREDYYTPPELLQMLHGGTRGTRLALVFGPEESGLSNTELDICHLVSAIPMRSAYPSLNLAQAVMVYCYELSPLRFGVVPARRHALDDAAMNVLYRKTEAALVRLGFDPGRALYRRVLERTGAAHRTDAHLILSVINALNSRLDELDR